jgi:N-acetylglutamate synthase-like GNAT family acetyltransferase
MLPAGLEIRPADHDDRPWMRERLTEWWGAPEIVNSDGVHDVSVLPALIALRDGRRIGLATYAVVGTDCELVTLNAVTPGAEVGSELLAAVAHAAVQRGCGRLWLITTNDNLDGLRFYQRRGLRLSEVRPGAVDRARQVKPSIPEIGEYGIPLHDELVLELALATSDRPVVGD